MEVLRHTPQPDRNNLNFPRMQSTPGPNTHPLHYHPPPIPPSLSLSSQSPLRSCLNAWQMRRRGGSGSGGGGTCSRHGEAKRTVMLRWAAALWRGRTRGWDGRASVGVEDQMTTKGETWQMPPLLFSLSPSLSTHLENHFFLLALCSVLSSQTWKKAQIRKKE